MIAGALAVPLQRCARRNHIFTVSSDLFILTNMTLLFVQLLILAVSTKAVSTFTGMFVEAATHLLHG